MDMNYREGIQVGGGVQRAERSEGGKWDNCNSIINKIHFKKFKIERSLLNVIVSYTVY